MARVWIGLGSNLGARGRQLAWAMQALSAWGPLRGSALYRTAPVGPQDQPDFFNAVATLDTSLAPEALLDRLQGLEQQAGRVRGRHWGERTLDLDVLLYGDQAINTPRLQVPHPFLTDRAFVLVPLLQLDPDLVVSGRLLRELPAVRKAMQAAALVQVADADWQRWPALDG